MPVSMCRVGWTRLVSSVQREPRRVDQQNGPVKQVGPMVAAEQDSPPCQPRGALPPDVRSSPCGRVLHRARRGRAAAVDRPRAKSSTPSTVTKQPRVARTTAEHEGVSSLTAASGGPVLREHIVSEAMAASVTTTRASRRSPPASACRERCGPERCSRGGGEPHRVGTFEYFSDVRREALVTLAIAAPRHYPDDRARQRRVALLRASSQEGRARRAMARRGLRARVMNTDNTSI